MIIRKLRLQRGWSQEQLAALTGLSVRTIQRLERGHKAGLESLTSLASVFELTVAEIQAPQQETIMENTIEEPTATITEEEKIVIKQVQDLKAFYSNLASYCVVISLLWAINLISGPQYIWAIWPTLGWGIGVMFHGLCVFEVVNLFSAKWEKKQIERRLGRDL